jgi:uncharacterized membrane protein
MLAVVRISDDVGGMERIEFFSDAVFAIAITLLVITLAVPNGSPAALGSNLAKLQDRFFAIGLSFVVIGQFWIAHHRAYRYIVRYDLGLLWLNLLYLFGVCFLPFPTEVLGHYFESTLAGVFYGLTMTATSVAGGLMLLYADRRGLMGEAAAGDRRELGFRSAVTPIVFLAGTALTGVSNTLAALVWAVVLPLLRLGFTHLSRRRAA